ncbi:MAG: dimethyl sulfoxide reductase anchor subunit, partial [Burkholderiales bacterium]|nr:dimethyl sulfoxide reductase anchor subunit [Burkholderiales bacterium]
MSYGPAPWQQTQWDLRAAANFVCGGAGSGLIVFAAASGARGLALALLLLGGVALVGTGLLCVWLEIGRPLRALHVLFNPRTSWMTREAFVAMLLVPVALAAAAGLPAFIWPAAALALAFVYCQSRILRAAKGIPTWREPWLQRHWDVRAAMNFILGGTGAGLLLSTALVAHAAPGWKLPLALGLALIAAGLGAVWLEIGRKLRAVHVFFNPRTSWMTRESFAALLVFALGATALALGRP